MWGSFTSCIPVTFNNHPASTLSNYTAMICANGSTGGFCDSVAHTNLAVANFKGTGSGGDATSASGFDIIPHSNNNCSTRLSFELVAPTYVSATGAFEMHVLIPSLSSSVDTIIYMGVGDATITTDQSSTAAWDSNFLLVSHYPNGSSLTVTDSTSNGNNGTITGGVTASAGQIDGAATFNGSTGYVTNGAVTVPVSSSLTASLWVFPTSFATVEVVLSNSVSTNDFLIYIDTNATIGCHIAPLNNTTITSTTIPINTWSYLTCKSSVSTGAPKIFINGVEASYSQVGGTGATSGFTGLRVGAYADLSLKYTGRIDEPRFSLAYDSDATILTTYNNQSAPWNFYTFGSPIVISNSAPRRVISFQ